MNARVTAIFVTYNSQRTIGEALNAARAAHEQGMLDCIVVDNQSGDGTAALVEEAHPWVKLIRSPENLGYGRGLNLGLQHTDTEYILFMNPDAVLEAGELAKLIEFMEVHPSAGLVAPAIVEADGVIQGAGGLLTPWDIVARAAGWSRPHHRQRQIHPGQEPFQTQWLCGAIMLARLQTLKEIGGFDPRFFLYFEETDLCRRISQHGLELWAVGKAIARHVGGHSTKACGTRMFEGCIGEHYFRSRFYFFAKHYGLAAAAFAELAELVILAIRDSVRWVARNSRGDFARRVRQPILRLPRRWES